MNLKSSFIFVVNYSSSAVNYSNGSNFCDTVIPNNYRNYFASTFGLASYLPKIFTEKANDIFFYAVICVTYNK